MTAWNSHFSHIYIEEDATVYPDTRMILDAFPKARQISIRNYKDIFNRPGQVFQNQKRSMKMVLAVKHGTYIYDGSSNAPNFGRRNFYYNAMIHNCVYNCDYCYLQGMYDSANLIIFVNQQPFFDAASQVYDDNNSIYLCISYDTDLLAFERIVPNCRRWIDWAEQRADAMIEIRTKSTNFGAIADIPPPRNTVLAWTLSPQVVAHRYESKTPSLEARLAAVREAIKLGWNVRLCFDPLIHIKDWRRIYEEMIDYVSESTALDDIFDFSIGVFRMPKDYLRRINSSRKDSDVLFYPFTDKNKIYTYPDSITDEITDYVKNRILKHCPRATVYL